MKRFEFRLQRTMDWRQNRSELEKSELERLHGARTQLSESRTGLEDELQQLGRSSAAQESCNAEQLHQQAMFTSSLHNLDRQLAAQENRCLENIEQQVQKCVTADREHRLLEKLRDTTMRQWVYAHDREVEETATENWNSLHGRRPFAPGE